LESRAYAFISALLYLAVFGSTGALGREYVRSTRDDVRGRIGGTADWWDADLAVVLLLLAAITTTATVRPMIAMSAIASSARRCW
jgi:phage shock protein PspC (stress-responsive transcriptional regulator)